MNHAVYRTLEFDRIREVLAREASTSLGRARALALEPATDAGDVQRRLDLTREAVALVASSRRLALDAPENLDGILADLALDVEPLAPLHLLGLARFIGSVTATATGVRENGGPGLRDIVAGVREFAAEIAGVAKAVMPSGDISDDASPALRDIRDALRRQRAKLRSTLEGLTRGRDTAKYLQDQNRHRPAGTVRARRADRTQGRPARHRAWQLRERREPLRRAAVDGGPQQ